MQVVIYSRGREEARETKQELVHFNIDSEAHLLRAQKGGIGIDQYKKEHIQWKHCRLSPALSSLVKLGLFNQLDSQGGAGT